MDIMALSDVWGIVWCQGYGHIPGNDPMKVPRK